MSDNTDFQPTNPSDFKSNEEQRYEEITKNTPKEVALYQNQGQTPEERKKHVLDLVDTLDDNTTESIDNFGLEPQEFLAKTPTEALKARDASNKNLGDVGQELKQLSVTLNTNQVEDNVERHGLDKLFHSIIHKAKQTPYEIRANYQSAGVTIDMITKGMQQSSDRLKGNNEVIGQLYKDTRAYYVQLQDYIDALQIKLKTLDEDKIPRLEEKLKANPDPLLNEDLRKLRGYRTRVSKRLYNLQLSQAQALDFMPQLDLIKHTNDTLQQQIHDSILMQVPIWRNQVMEHLAVMDAQAAQQATDAFNETTHKMIEANRQTLKQTAELVSENDNKGIISEEDLRESHKTTMEIIKHMQEQIDKGNKARDEAISRITKIADDYSKEIHSQLNSPSSTLQLDTLKHNTQTKNEK